MDERDDHTNMMMGCDDDQGEEVEELDIEPTRVVGVSSNEFWDHEPTNEEIFEVRIPSCFFRVT